MYDTITYFKIETIKACTMKFLSTLGFICSVSFSQSHRQETRNISFLCIFPEFLCIHTNKYKYVFLFLSIFNANGSIMYTRCPYPGLACFLHRKLRK